MILGRQNRENRVFDEVIIRYLVEDWADDDDENYDLYFDSYGNPNPIMDNIQLVYSKMNTYDLEDGYAMHDIVIYIQNEDKYFQGDYTELSQDANEYNCEFFEVFPTTETVTIYK